MSRIDIKHQGKVVGGKIVHCNPDLYQQQLYELESKEIYILVKERHRKVTSSQQGFYRGGILPSCHNSEIFSYFDTKDDIHTNYFAPKFLSYIVPVKIKNEQYEVKKVRSLTELNDKEMSVFIERVLAECTELGILILSPEEYSNKNYNNIL